MYSVLRLTPFGIWVLAQRFEYAAPAVAHARMLHYVFGDSVMACDKNGSTVASYLRPE